MLANIRKGLTSFVTTILIGLLIISFAIWGIGDAFRFSTGNAIATVGDQVITPEQYARELRGEMRRWQQQLGSDLSLEQAKELGIPLQVLQRMVNRETYNSAAQKLGLRASDTMVYNAIRDTKEFKNSFGEFDLSLYNSLLRSVGMTVPEFERGMRDDITRRQLLGTLIGLQPAPTDLAKQLFAYHAERRSIGVMRFPASTITSVGEPSDEQLQAFYKDGLQNYMTPEYRAITVLTLTPDNFAGSVEITEKDLKDYYEANADEYGQPEKREVQQIVVSDKDTADKAHAAIVSGQDFAAAAKEFAGLSGDDINLGAKSEADIAGEISMDAAAAVFALDKDNVTKPVESPFGWHILKVTNITAGSQQSFEQVRDAIEKAVRREKALDILYAEVNKIEDEVASGATLEDIAQNLKAPLFKTEAVDANGKGKDGKAIELPEISGLLDAAFKTEPGADLMVQDAGNDHYYVLAVDDVIPQAAKPLDTIRDQVVADWKASERNKAAKALADAARKALEDGKPFSEAAAGARDQQAGILIGRVPLPGTVNVTQDIRQAAFSVGDFGTAVVASADGDGYLVVQTLASMPGDADSNAELFAEFKKGFDVQYDNDLLAHYQEYLQRSLNSRFNRELMEATLSQINLQ